jgi:hypothetical protein
VEALEGYKAAMVAPAGAPRTARAMPEEVACIDIILKI